jgi:hypothetical protein
MLRDKTFYWLTRHFNAVYMPALCPCQLLQQVSDLKSSTWFIRSTGYAAALARIMKLTLMNRDD